MPLSNNQKNKEYVAKHRKQQEQKWVMKNTGGKAAARALRRQKGTLGGRFVHTFSEVCISLQSVHLAE